MGRARAGASMRRRRRENLPLGAAILSVAAAAVLAFAYLAAPPPARASPRELVLPTSVRAGAGYPRNFCSGAAPKNFLGSSSRAWLALLLPAIVAAFVGLALITDEYFVPALAIISERLDLSEDVAGATFMAAGSSAPELFTSLLSTFWGGDDLGVGTIVGSAVFNVCVIIAISALFAKQALDLDFRPLLRDAFFYSASVLLLLVFVLFSTKGIAHWWEGLVFVLCYALYILFMAFANKPYLRATARWARREDAPPDAKIARMEGGGIDASTVTETDESAFHPETEADVVEHASFSDANSAHAPPRTFLGVQLPTSALGWATLPLFFPWRFAFAWTVPNCAVEGRERRWPFTFIMSIVWVIILTFIMSEAAKVSGCFIGIPSSAMGLTVLAAGTSVPDALASVAVARAGHGNMAVSNAIGSNVFDILLGLGVPWLIGGLVKKTPIRVTVEPVGLVVIPIAILFGIILMLLTVLPCLRWKLGKPLGAILLAMYVAFLTYALLDVLLINRRLHMGA